MEAVRRRVPLGIVHVLDYCHCRDRAHAQSPRHDLTGRFRHDLPHRARSALARASRGAAEAAPGVDLRTVAVFGRADQLLTALTAKAALLVIGTRGTGGFPGLRLGSVALHLACHAKGPVVFAPLSTSPVVGEILVGLDDGDDATAVLGFGFGEADARGARLTALHAWTNPHAGRIDSYRDWVLSVGPLNQGVATLLSEQVAPWRGRRAERRRQLVSHRQRPGPPGTDGRGQEHRTARLDRYPHCRPAGTGGHARRVHGVDHARAQAGRLCRARLPGPACPAVITMRRDPGGAADARPAPAGDVPARTRRPRKRSSGPSWRRPADPHPSSA